MNAGLGRFAGSRSGHEAPSVATAVPSRGPKFDPGLANESLAQSRLVGDPAH